MRHLPATWISCERTKKLNPTQSGSAHLHLQAAYCSSPLEKLIMMKKNVSDLFKSQTVSNLISDCQSPSRSGGYILNDHFGVQTNQSSDDLVSCFKRVALTLSSRLSLCLVIFHLCNFFPNLNKGRDIWWGFRVSGFHSKNLTRRLCFLFSSPDHRPTGCSSRELHWQYTAFKLEREMFLGHVAFSVTSHSRTGLVWQ